MPKESEQLASHLAARSYEELPADTIALAKRAILDHLGVALYSAALPWSRMVTDMVRTEAASGTCTVYGQDWCSSPRGAALVNGTLGHGFELDDTHEPGMTHPAPPVIPAVLAMAERSGKGGRDVLRAIVLGYEVVGRVGRAVAPSHMITRGFHPTGTNGVFGAAAGAALALGFDGARLLQALGIAGSLASGLTEFCEDEADGMVKRLHGGRAAEGGVTAALLAERGFTGPRSVLEGRFGYCHAFADDANVALLAANLGEDWEIRAVSTKPYACGRIFHAVFDALGEIGKERPFTPDQVRRVRVGGIRKMAEQHMTYEPQSVMAAQYSLPFTTAAAIVRDPFDPETFGEAGVADPKIRELIGRIEGYEDPEIQALSARKYGAKVSVELTDGTTHSRTVLDCKGSVVNPLSHAELEARFHRLAGGVLSATRRDAVVEAIAELDQADTIGRLTGLLRIGPGDA